MANINRDYLIVLDAKSSVISEADDLKYYITDEHSQNLFVNLVVRDTQRINKYVEVHNPEKYQLELHIVKPNNDIVRPHLQANLLSVPDAIYAFELPKEAVDYIGTYKCELRVTYKETDETTITTSNKFKYKVKRSIYNDLDSIQDAPQYPVVIQLFDKLSDINKYEEDRRANELARQLAEQQRQTRFDALDADMVDNIQEMDDKVVEVENRITTKEQAVDKLIVDTKADIDNYKVAKDQEIDDYKTAKDTEINNVITAQHNKINTAITTQNNIITQAIANQDTKIDTAITAQNDKIEAVQNNDAVQNNKLDTLQNKATIHEERITATEVKNTEQDNRLDIAENRLNNIGNDITNTMQPIIDAHTSRLDAIEAINVAQNTRLDNIEVKNQEQDDRLLDIEKVNKRQDMNLKCLFAESKNNMIDITEEGNSIYLQNSTTGYALIDEIKGNTLVNCNKEPNKELILNGNINTSGDKAVTITEGVDGGLVDVALEGNTLVNVSKTKDSTTISKAYTVENSGNHIALQGDIDGSCRPVITGNTLVNLANIKSIYTDNNLDYDYHDETVCKTSLLKLNTAYTFIIEKEFLDGHNMNYNTFQLGVGDKNLTKDHPSVSSGSLTFDYNTNKYQTALMTVSFADFKGYEYLTVRPCRRNTAPVAGEKGNYKIKIVLLEGDYSDKPIPDYFEGLQSSFEDNLVTQEMVDSGEEVADNLGKYRVEYKSTQEDGTVGSTKTLYLNSPLLEGDTIEEKDGGIYHVHRYTKVVFDGSDDEGWVLHNSDWQSDECVSFGADFLNAKSWNWGEFPTSSILIDKIPVYGNQYCYNNILGFTSDNRYTKNKVIKVPKSYLTTEDLSGFKVWLSENPVTVVYELASPTYELIEQSNLVIPSYANGHLDFNTAVPVDKVDFLPFNEELTYLYANTQYTVQFISDKAIAIDITLGGTQLLAQSIVEGLNRISITTPETLADNRLTINGNGTGANIMEVVVTDTNREFMYFEGMKSVGECEELEITSANSDNSASNTQQLTHEPLRAVGDAKDRYVLIDGKWYIERKYGEKVLDGSNYTIYPINTRVNTKKRWTICNDYSIKDISSPNQISTINNKYCNISAGDSWNASKEGVSQNNSGHYIHLYLERYSDGSDASKQSLISELQESPMSIVYQLATPTYEPIDYNPLEVYSGTTNITTNSVIPCNITVKNHGFNCLLKPSTTYTISSNLGLNTVTTPSTLTEDCLRFMDTDTSDVTTMRDVLVLEGDWTTKADSIPSNFSGMESAFEQEYDTEKGKYKVNVKVVNEDKSKENNITFYINEPLRGVGNIKDRIYVKDDKVIVQRNCGIRAYEDGDFGTYLTDKINTIYPLAEPTYEEVEYNDTKLFIESFKNSTLSYNSNVPVTSKLHYSYSVPIVDTVAQTANVTDQQDSMIIDLATQVAVMEMMLM